MNIISASAQSSYFGIAMKFVVLAIVLGLGYTVFSEWNIFVATVVEWQKELHSMLASHINAVSEDALKYGGALIALSFGYGVFHAIGPGHGKAVIVTYLGTSKESLKKGIAISFIAAILQAVIAILLVSALAQLLKFKFSEVHNYGNDMALVSYVLVICLGLMLLFSALKRIFKHHRVSIARTHDDHSHGHHAHEHSHDHVHDDHSHAHSHAHSHIHHAHEDHGHSHVHRHEHLEHDHHHRGESCGCSHTHVPEEKETLWQTMTVVLSMGFRPCSGAIVVLIYAHLVGVYSYGVVATMMMGVGTGLSVSLIAVATLYARSWIERFANSSGVSALAHPAYVHYVRLIGGCILVALGWSFYSAASSLSAGHPLF